jgi:hypothetical protein
VTSVSVPRNGGRCDRLLEEEEFAGWLTFDFSKGPGKTNGFGLYGLFVGEWCADLFTSSYTFPAASESASGPRVVRGGGAFFWPWQDQEWVWCMSAMRSSSTDLPDGKCGFRFVRNIRGDCDTLRARVRAAGTRGDRPRTAP